MAGKILVTGATGFIGGEVVRRLVADAADVVAAIRRPAPNLAKIVPCIEVTDLTPSTLWSGALKGVHVVVHAAALVQVSKNTPDPLSEFRLANVQGTLNLARQAVAEGAKRFVFISSIKVNGEQTSIGKPFHADDIPAPHDAYGISKMEAEQGLRALAQETGLELVIIRPPLVYGAGVKANFRWMTRWLQLGVPLPLGAIDNRRSFVALDNLVDLIVTCIHSPAAINQTFLVSDGEDVSSTQLLRRMGQSLGKPAKLIPIPCFLLKCAARLLGKPGIAMRLCGSLQVDITKTKQLLNWSPPLSMDAGLKKAAEGFLCGEP